jgi:hypothetical protein
MTILVLRVGESVASPAASLRTTLIVTLPAPPNDFPAAKDGVSSSNTGGGILVEASDAIVFAA